MMYTVADARTFMGPFVRKGVCKQSALDARIDECTRRLLDQVDAKYTIRWLRVCTTNNTFALPREVESIRHVTIDCNPTQAWGQPYEFLSHGPGEVKSGGNLFKYLVDMGDGFPTFFDLPSMVETSASCADNRTDVFRLVAFSTQFEDSSLSLTVRGKDVYSADIFTGSTLGITLPINQWATEGNINLDVGVSYSDQIFRDITAVHKPATKGFVSLYTYDPDTHRMYFLAKYHPDETVPGYRRFKLTAPQWTNGSNIILLVKLRHIPVKNAEDVLIIQNLDALKLMSQAIDYENDGEVQRSVAYESNAIRLLTEQLRNSRVNFNGLSVEDNSSLQGLNIR